MNQKTPKNNLFLFSVDLEDVRDGVEQGHRYKDRVVENTLAYLHWLKKYDSHCTFFTVGKIAERYPDLIKEIMGAGHELACHSYDHTPVDKFTPDEFKTDLEKNLNALTKAGASNVSGFRAPVFSLTEKTEWAHSVLNDLGFKYSSSVLPAKNPLYGWEGFGASVKKVSENLIEIPMSLNTFGPLMIPFAGGVYFRVLPFFLIKKSFEKVSQNNKPVLSYFHPYDLDTKQEQFMHGGINNSKFYNYLMYFNRKNMLGRLDKIMENDLKIMRYDEYIKSLSF